MEKIPLIHNDSKESERIVNEIMKAKKEVKEMLKKQEAYYVDEYDEKGNLKSIKIFRSSDGEMIFFDDIEGLKKFIDKF